MSANASTLTPAREVREANPAAVPWLQGALLLASGAFVFHPVSVTWVSNANYSFGWWIPVVALFLFSERWPTRPARTSHTHQGRLVPVLVLWGLFYFALRMAAEADPDWRPGLWIIIGIYLAALVGWLRIYGGTGWVRHFAFPVGFLLLSLPWPFSLENALVQGLMHWNAILATVSLQLLGIPAIASGNIIKLANCQLGVEEACSGILSLQASLVLGCLLGEIYQLSVIRRFTLVLITMLLALVGNYGRTFFLALLASYHGTPAVTAWHDTAGFSILIFAALGSWVASLYLNTKVEPVVPSPVEPAPEGASPVAPKRQALSLAIGLIAITALSEVGTQAWYGWRESKIPRQTEWTAVLPEASSFKPIPVSQTTQGILMCDSYKAGSWLDAQGWKWTTFWFQYNPKPSNRIVLGWHTPDNCLPSVGLIKDRDYPDFIAVINGIHFLVQPRKFLSGDSAIYLFWVIYPTSGELPTVIDNQPNAPVTSKFRMHLDDVWKGYRGVGVETLETSVEGPASYEAAEAAYLDLLKKLVTPNSLPR